MTGESNLAETVQAIRPILPARNFALSIQFYQELGFQLRMLHEGLAEMHLGAFSFLLQNYYAEQWANNCAIHLRVSDLTQWWNRIAASGLAERYKVETRPPAQEAWGMVAGVVDPSGVLWRIYEYPASQDIDGR